MRYPSCGFKNPEGMKFCGQCASPLGPHCPQCGFDNPAGFAFCGQCATPLTEQPPALQPQAPHRYIPSHLAEKILTSKTALEGERKQVTVLFADPKRSLAWLADREAADARPLLESVLWRAMGAVHPDKGVVTEEVTAGGWRVPAPPRARFAALCRQRNCWDTLIGPAVRRGSISIRGEG